MLLHVADERTGASYRVEVDAPEGRLLAGELAVCDREDAPCARYAFTAALQDMKPSATSGGRGSWQVAACVVKRVAQRHQPVDVEFGRDGRWHAGVLLE